MTRNPFPFTWPEFEREIGRELHPDIKTRVTRAAAKPGPATWRAARTAIVAPQMSQMGQTLWQCVEAVTLTRYPDGPDKATVGQAAIAVPDQRAVVLAMCYAAGLPYRGA